jgi:hypothetical protein
MSGIISYTTLGGKSGLIGPTPSFMARTSSGTISATTEVVWQTAQHNLGGHYSTSTGRFTAPVQGVYYFSVSGRHNSSTAGGLDMVIGGAQSTASQTLARLEFAAAYPAYSQLENSGMFLMNAGEYCSCIVYSGQLHFDNNYYAHFAGYFVCEGGSRE